VRTTIEATLEAYQQALTRKDEVALRAVYPRVPKEVIEAWTKKDTGVKYSTVQIIQTRSELDGPTRVQVECTFFYNFITGPGRDRAIPQKRLLVLERRGESWEVADDRKR
jgi:hypothetical protein